METVDYVVSYGNLSWRALVGQRENRTGGCWGTFSSGGTIIPSAGFSFISSRFIWFKIHLRPSDKHSKLISDSTTSIHLF